MQNNLPAPALQRGLLILELLKDGKSRSLEEIAGTLKFPKSSVIRLMETLARMFYVARDEATKLYTTKVALFPQTQRQSKFREVVQEHLETLAKELNMTVEWFTPQQDHMLLTQRCENTNSSVCIRAQLGHERTYWGEFDAISRIAHKVRKPKGSKKKYEKCWKYKKGDQIQISSQNITQGIASIGDDIVTIDDEYNPNGIRRMAKGIRDIDGSLFGILSIPEHYNPKSEAIRKIRLDMLQKKGAALEKNLKEI